jgi:hypothetical protein
MVNDEVKFPGLEDKRPLPVDYVIKYRNCQILIELDGIHHFKITSYGGHKTPEELEIILKL